MLFKSQRKYLKELIPLRYKSPKSEKLRREVTERSGTQDMGSGCSSAPKGARGPPGLGSSRPQFLHLQNRQRPASFPDDSMWPQAGHAESRVINSKDLGGRGEGEFDFVKALDIQKHIDPLSLSSEANTRGDRAAALPLFS